MSLLIPQWGKYQMVHYSCELNPLHWQLNDLSPLMGNIVGNYVWTKNCLTDRN